MEPEKTDIFLGMVGTLDDLCGEGTPTCTASRPGAGAGTQCPSWSAYPGMDGV